MEIKIEDRVIFFADEDISINIEIDLVKRECDIEIIEGRFDGENASPEDFYEEIVMTPELLHPLITISDRSKPTSTLWTDKNKKRSFGALYYF